jgi:hypothetical protein
MQHKLTKILNALALASFTAFALFPVGMILAGLIY